MGKEVSKHTLLSIRFRMVLDGYTAFCNFLEIGKSLGPQTLRQGLLKRLRDVAGFVVGRSFVIRPRVGSSGLPIFFNVTRRVVFGPPCLPKIVRM